jgi:t-SNARE complex subunit (syntaxin)
MTDMLSKNDHDMIIRIGTTMEAHNRQEDDVRRVMLAELSKLTTKVDRILEIYPEQARDIKDMRSEVRNQDIRIATLEAQVESLQDGVEEHKIIAKTNTENIERRSKQWRWALVVLVPIISIVMPVVFNTVIKWLAGAL